MADLERLLADLRAEGDELDGVVSSLSEQAFRRPTPAPDWSIAHQIAHLSWADDMAVLAATDPDAFAIEVEKAIDAVETYVDDRAAEGARQSPTELLDRWRRSRTNLLVVLTKVPAGMKLPWFGVRMSPASMVTGRLMETWAHGQDITDALGIDRKPTGRLRHVAHIAVRARNFAFQLRELPVPDEEFRVDLTSPGDDMWMWGPRHAEQRVTGPALDFCLLATQRRHRADTALVAIGADANTWLDIAQAFAGPAGPGRRPGQFG